MCYRAAARMRNGAEGRSPHRATPGDRRPSCTVPCMNCIYGTVHDGRRSILHSSIIMVAIATAPLTCSRRPPPRLAGAACVVRAHHAQGAAQGRARPAGGGGGQAGAHAGGAGCSTTAGGTRMGAVPRSSLFLPLWHMAWHAMSACCFDPQAGQRRPFSCRASELISGTRAVANQPA